MSKPEPYISISIDLAGSTRTKQLISNIKSEDHELRQAHYAELVRALLRVEDRFYRRLFCPAGGGASKPLDSERFFVVKNIGDEIWMLYRMPSLASGHMVSTMARILDAAYDVLARGTDFVATSELEKPDFSPDDDIPDQVVPIFSELKIFIDLIEDYAELSAIREEYLIPRLPAYGSDPGVQQPIYRRGDPKIRQLVHSLNIGYMVDTTFIRRTDIMGLEVDRFFRASKAAVAGVVTVGDTLFPHIGLKADRTEAEVEIGAAMVPHNPDNPEGSGCREETTYWHRSEIPENNLKGLDGKYWAWYLASDCLLRQILNRRQVRPGSFNQNSPDDLESARKIFPRELIYPLKP